MQILTLSPVRGLWRGKHENGKSAGRHRPPGRVFDSDQTDRDFGM